MALSFRKNRSLKQPSVALQSVSTPLEKRTLRELSAPICWDQILHVGLPTGRGA